MIQPWWIRSCVLFVGALQLLGCNRPSQDNPQSNASAVVVQSDAPLIKVSESQALGFAEELVRQVQQKDLDRIDELVNMRLVTELALRKVDYPAQIEDIYLNAAAKQSMLASLLSRMDGFASYEKLRLKKVDDGVVVICRLVTRDGSVAHQEFALVLDRDERPVAADMFTSALGEWMQEGLLRDMARQFIVRGETIEVSDSAKLFLEHKPTFDRMLQAVNYDEGLVEALADFRSVPDELHEDRRYLLLATTIAQRISLDELAIEYERLAKYVSEQAILDPYLMDLCFRQNRFDEFRSVLQRMEDRVGGDPYFDLLRGRALLKEDRIDEAKMVVEKVRSALPNVYAIYATSVAIAVKERSSQQVMDLLREIDTRFNQPIDLPQTLTDAGFPFEVLDGETLEFCASIEKQLEESNVEAKRVP